VFISVTLRLPAKLKMRIARAAKQRGQSTQRWMLEAIKHEVERRERFLAYVIQAQHADLDPGPVDEIETRNRVRFWLEQLSTGRKVTRVASRRER
jgi:predicted transcriptional regulator